ncbi:hypothetical protein [Moorena sp. SIO4G3]|uniref:hypothetical protein n=1 Tax=Moorena sp. SIO4G3 TaxID=2607821 RepID=UPI00142C5A2D|nr:hypothetical protein [Moorena sp. SIO4G3]NEO78946.1 hypothetical protein [Moorena sp. SIO4G3]
MTGHQRLPGRQIQKSLRSADAIIRSQAVDRHTSSNLVSINPRLPTQNYFDPNWHQAPNPFKQGKARLEY